MTSPMGTVMSKTDKATKRKPSFFVRLLRLTFLLGVLAVVAAGALGYKAWEFLHQPHQGYEDERLIRVEPGTGASAILRQLEREGVLPDARIARLYLIHVLKDPSLKAGEYRFDEPLHTPAVLDRLIRGEVVTYPVTLIEGLTLDEAAATIAAAGFGDQDVLRREMDRVELIQDLDPEANNLEGYLYPDTYHFARGTTEEEIIATLLRTFRKKFSAEVEPLLDGYDGTMRELVTLASIIEKEAQIDEERPTVSSVYTNRLRIGMPLQADPTTIYALKLLGTWNGNLRRPDLRMDHPYNTYVHGGLPPGPICSPGVKSMAAAVVPAETPYLYFVSRNDGTHVFARSLREHNRNVDVWQKQYWRRKWAEERRARESGE